MYINTLWGYIIFLFNLAMFMMRDARMGTWSEPTGGPSYVLSGSEETLLPEKKNPLIHSQIRNKSATVDISMLIWQFHLAGRGTRKCIFPLTHKKLFRKCRLLHSEINNNSWVSLDGDRKRVSFVKIKIRAHISVCVILPPPRPSLMRARRAFLKWMYNSDVRHALCLLV